MRGVNPAVGSVASVFVSRWDVAVADTVPADLRDQLGLAVGLDVYRSYRQMMDSEGWQRLGGAGAASAFALGEHRDEGPRCAGHAVCARLGRAVHGQHDARLDARGILRPRRGGDAMPADGGRADELLSRFADAGVDTQALAAQLQSDGAKSFVSAWADLMQRIDAQHASLT